MGSHPLQDPGIKNLRLQNHRGLQSWLEVWELPRKCSSRGAVSREGLHGVNSARGDPAGMGREFWLAKKCRQQRFKF